MMMNTIKIINTPIGYFDSIESVTFNQEVENIDCPNDSQLEDIFKDLCPDPGIYEYRFEYEKELITIYQGVHTPVGQCAMRIDSSWLSNDINRMSNYSYRNRIKNNID